MNKSELMMMTNLDVTRDMFGVKEHLSVKELSEIQERALDLFAVARAAKLERESFSKAGGYNDSWLGIYEPDSLEAKIRRETELTEQQCLERTENNLCFVFEKYSDVYLAKACRYYVNYRVEDEPEFFEFDEYEAFDEEEFTKHFRYILAHKTSVIVNENLELSKFYEQEILRCCKHYILEYVYDQHIDLAEFMTRGLSVVEAFAKADYLDYSWQDNKLIRIVDINCHGVVLLEQ